MTEKLITGTLAVVDGQGFDDDPEFAGMITIVQETKIRVPIGLMTDCVLEYWNEYITATYTDVPHLGPVLMCIDWPNEDDEAETERQLALADYRRRAADTASPPEPVAAAPPPSYIAAWDQSANRLRASMDLTAISGRVLGYLPLGRMVQIQPEACPPVEVRNWLGVGEIDFNRHLGQRARLYLSGGPRPMIVNAVFE